MKIWWRCPCCGRDKFESRYKPHRCVGGYRKNFRKASGTWQVMMEVDPEIALALLDGITENPTTELTQPTA